MKRTIVTIVVLVALMAYASITVCASDAKEEVLPADYYVGSAVGNFGLESFVGGLALKAPTMVFVEYGRVVSGPAKDGNRVSVALPEYFGPTWLNYGFADSGKPDSWSIARAFPATIKVVGRTKLSISVFIAGGRTLLKDENEFFAGGGASFFYGF